MAKNWAEFNQPPTNDIYTAPRLGVSGAMVFNELLSIELAPEGAPGGGGLRFAMVASKLFLVI